MKDPKGANNVRNFLNSRIKAGETDFGALTQTCIPGDPTLIHLLDEPQRHSTLKISNAFLKAAQT